MGDRSDIDRCWTTSFLCGKIPFSIRRIKGTRYKRYWHYVDDNWCTDLYSYTHFEVYH